VIRRNRSVVVNPMNSSDSLAFAVLQFSLEIGADGRPTQKTTARGEYGSVEQAFSVARSLAELERGHMERTASIAGGVWNIELVDTEWGYDLRQGWLVRTRFWVHDRAPASLGV
jgi:hypothetical protein